MTRRALLIVDVQNDFLPGGALSVPEGDEVIPVINRIQRHFDLVVASQDWHPRDHVSFAANHPGKQPGEVIDAGGIEQVLWPVHCVENTRGAELAAALDRWRIERVFRKGVERDVDGYSALFDNARRRSTGLGEFLDERQVDELSIAGLATDYCVKWTVRDARGRGMATRVVVDACRGIDLAPGEVERALDEMRAAGAVLVESSDLADAAPFA
jgi:nicotinamidase/pyrazinamidase